MVKWDLSKLYKSYDSKEFQNDLKKINSYIIKANEFKSLFINGNNETEVIANYLLLDIEINDLIQRLYSFVSLNQATNTTDSDSVKYGVILHKKLTEFTEINTLFSKYISSVKDIDKVIQENEFLKEHAFIIKEVIKNNKFKLDEKTEGLLSKLKQSSSGLWERLMGVLTSTLEVEYNGSILTLPEVLGKAEDKTHKFVKVLTKQKCKHITKLINPSLLH